VTTPAKSSGAKAIDYAEKTLGVHDCFEKALAARNALDATLTSLSEARDNKRDLEDSLVTAELDVIAEERGKHPDMSQAQMDKHVKVALAANAEVSKLRALLREAVGNIDGLEMDETIAKQDISIYSARMIQLNGYFIYLTQAKVGNRKGGTDGSVIWN